MDPVGVGMVLRAKHDGQLEVTEIVPQGPVHNSAAVRLGDVLRKVDGKEVGRTVESARKLLLGQRGSKVALTLVRHEPFLGIEAVRMEHIFSVTVTRAACAVPPIDIPIQLVGQENKSNNAATDSKLEWELYEEKLKSQHARELAATLQENLTQAVQERDELRHQLRGAGGLTEVCFCLSAPLVCRCSQLDSPSVLSAPLVCRCSQLDSPSVNYGNTHLAFPYLCSCPHHDHTEEFHLTLPRTTSCAGGGCASLGGRQPALPER
eukprot:2158112-Rhodomonas_salina.2